MDNGKIIQQTEIGTLINDLNILIINNTNLNIDLKPIETSIFFSNLDQCKCQILKQVILYSKSPQKVHQPNLDKQPHLNLIIYGLIYILTRGNNTTLVKNYYQALIFLYHNKCISIHYLTAVTQLLILIDKNYNYHFELVNIVIKSIINPRHPVLPYKLFELFASLFNDQSCEYHLNTQFLLLLSIGDPDIKKLLFKFLIRIFKHQYSFSVTSFLVKALLKSNFWFKYNSIAFIKQLITEEEKIRKTETPWFFIKRGFLIQNSNPIIIQPFNSLEYEYTFISSFRFISPSNGNVNDKAVILEIKEVEKKKTCFEIFIQNHKLYINVNRSKSNVNSNFPIEPNKDYRIIVTQKKQTIGNTIFLNINGEIITLKCSFPEFSKKDLKFIFGQNYNGIIGTFILFTKAFQPKEEPDFFKYVHNLNEDYDLLFKVDNDLSLLKPYSNHIVSENENYYQSFKYFKDQKIKCDLVLSPYYANRFLKGSSSFQITDKIKVQLEKPDTSFVVKYFNHFTIFQFLNYEGLKYICLIFGLLSKESNDNINMFINKVSSFLFQLTDSLGGKYFDNKLNVLFTIIFNYIATNGTFKVNHTLFKSLFDKMNCFNLSDEYNLRNCLVKLLLNKDIYLNEMADTNAISLFSTVKSCINCNSTGLIKKKIVKQLLNYIHIIKGDDPSIKKSYKELLKVLIAASIRENKAKKFDPFITYLITTSDMSEVLHYKLLKIIYLNFGKDDIVRNNNEFVCYLVSQLESGTSLYHCKWCGLFKSLCFMIIIDYVNKSNEFRKKFILQIDRLCTHYVSMQTPSKEFIKCLFIQLFRQIPPCTKVDFIKGKASFKDITFNTPQKSSLIKSKLKSLEKYIEFIYERPVIVLTKYSVDEIIYLVNHLIKDMAEALKTKNKELKEAIESIFTSDSMVNYMLFLFKKNLGQPDVFLQEIIENTIEVIKKPFYFDFLYTYFNDYVDRVYDQQINNVVNMITKKLHSNLINDSISNNIYMFLIVLYKIISLGHTKVSIPLETYSILFISLITEKNQIIEQKEQYEVLNKKKPCLEIIIDILLMLYRYSNYNNKFKVIIYEIVRPKDKGPSIFYTIDKKQIEMRKQSDVSTEVIYYSYCIYFLLKFVNILYEERDNKQSFHFMQELAKETAYNASDLYQKFKTKYPFKSDYIKDRDYHDLASYIEGKFTEKRYELLESHFFGIFDLKKNNNKPVNEKVKDPFKNKNTSYEATTHTDQYFLRDSNPYKEHKEFVFEFPSDLDFNNPCEAIQIPKRSMSQHIGRIKNNILKKPPINKNGNFALNIVNQRQLFFIDNEEKKSIKFLFHLKHDLIWNTFPFLLKDYIFKNKTFISMKRCYAELYPIYNRPTNALKDLDYPTKVKNYTTKYYYKPFIKPDINFYSNPYYPISHPYYVQAKDNTMTQIHFSKILPKIKKKYIEFQSYCELFTNLGAIYGELVLCSNFILFVACPDKDIRFNKTIPVESKMQYAFSSDENDIIKTSNKMKLFYIDDIEEVILRRFFFQWIGFEFFLKNRQSYCINLFTEESKNCFLSKLTNISNKAHSSISIITNIQNEFKKNDYTRQWTENKMSTLHYLLLINKYASRTYNDIYQYPILPWITYDMKGTSRDMSNMICDQRPKIRQTIVHTQRNENQFSFHYSNGGHVLYYLVRQNPFTYTHIKFQSLKFDSAPRLFNSIKDTLMIFSLLKETRELTPEFFYDTNFLINLNKNDFGIVKERNYRIDDVTSNDNESNIRYIIEQRIKIEKMDEIFQWINNIFGVNQTKIGVKSLYFAKNTYEKNHNFKNRKVKWKSKGLSNKEIYDKIRCKLTMIAFGMTPYQLFPKSHPKKYYPQLSINTKQDFNCNNMKQHLLVNFSNTDDLCVGVSESRIYFKQLSMLNIFEVNLKERKDYLIKTIKFQKQAHLRFMASSFCELSKGIFAFCRFFDNTIKIHNIDDDVLSIQCNSFITSICSIGNNEFVTGDEHGFIRKWKPKNNNSGSDYSFYNDNKVIGHESEVILIIYNSRLDIIISIDELNICVIHNSSTLDLLNIIEVNSKIKDLKLSFQDLLFFLCNNGDMTQSLYCYTLNGLLVSKSKPTNDIAAFELPNNSTDIIIAHGSQIYKTNFFAFDLYKRDENDTTLIYSEGEKMVKEIVYVSEMKLVVYVFVDNTITLKMQEL